MIGEVFFFADIDTDILRPGIESYDLTGVDSYSRSDEEIATTLSGEKAIHHSGARLMGDERTVFSGVATSWIGSVFQERCVDSPQPVRVGNELTAKSEEIFGRDDEFHEGK